MVKPEAAGDTTRRGTAFDEAEMETLQRLALDHPAVGKLLKQNYSLSVVVLWQQLHALDARLTRHEADCRSKFSELESRLVTAGEKYTELKQRVGARDERPA